MRRVLKRVRVSWADLLHAAPQVVQGAGRFFAATRPPYVMAECNDPMMLAATGRPASALLAQVGPPCCAPRHMWRGVGLSRCQAQRIKPACTPYLSSMLRNRNGILRFQMLICLHVALLQMHELRYRAHLQSFEGPPHSAAALCKVAGAQHPQLLVRFSRRVTAAPAHSLVADTMAGSQYIMSPSHVGVSFHHITGPAGAVRHTCGTCECSTPDASGPLRHLDQVGWHWRGPWCMQNLLACYACWPRSNVQVVAGCRQRAGSGTSLHTGQNCWVRSDHVRLCRCCCRLPHGQGLGGDVGRARNSVWLQPVLCSRQEDDDAFTRWQCVVQC